MLKAPPWGGLLAGEADGEDNELRYEDGESAAEGGALGSADGAGNVGGVAEAGAYGNARNVGSVAEAGAYGSARNVGSVAKAGAYGSAGNVGGVAEAGAYEKAGIAQSVAEVGKGKIVGETGSSGIFGNVVNVVWTSVFGQAGKSLSTSTSGALSVRAGMWRQLATHRLALLGLGLLCALTLLALIAPWLSPYDYDTQQLAARNEGPSAAHWFGTDDFGRDLWTRIWWGARISLLIGVCAALIDLVIGVVYGGISAYAGGRVDDALQRLLEVIYAVPYLLVAILLIMAIGPGLPSIIAAYALTGWVPMARLVRGQLLSLKEREYVLAAQALGASGLRIVWRHLLPNALSVMIVQLTFAVPAAMFAEAFLSFIGLGLKPPFASLGNLLSEGSGYIRFHQHRLIGPAVVFSLLLVSFNLLGDGLRDALDPGRRR